ncbi:MAG TPA: hypothetical protein VGE76_00310, partial [Opitutaceae bacterium]
SLPPFLAKCVVAANAPLIALTGRSLPLTQSRLKALLETTHFVPRRLREAGFVHPQSTADGLKEMVQWYRTSESASKR